MKHQGQCLASGFNDSGLKQQFFYVLLATIVNIFRSKMIYYADHRQPSMDWLGSYLYSYGICCLLTADWSLVKLISNWCSLVRAGVYETGTEVRKNKSLYHFSMNEVGD